MIYLRNFMLGVRIPRGVMAVLTAACLADGVVSAAIFVEAVLSGNGREPQRPSHKLVPQTCLDMSSFAMDIGGCEYCGWAWTRTDTGV